MKKIFGLMLLCVAAVIFASCEKEYIPQEVEFSIDYTFAKSGSMSRSTGNEVYDAFYDKYIKSKVLTPKTYELIFTNKETGSSSTIRGRWDEKDGIRLLEGQYEVVGKSIPLHKRDDFKEFSDSVYIAFNEIVAISKDDTKLLLTAKYDSFLLMFDEENTKSISCNCTGYTGSTMLSKDENNFWIFMQQTYRSTEHTKGFNLDVLRNDGLTSVVPLLNFSFEKGKYYYFNDMTNSFNIPPMESGN